MQHQHNCSFVGAIGDLLDVARIETGTLPVSPEPVDVTVLVDEARSRFQSGGGRANLVIGIPPNLPRVLADRRRIVKVLNNLLSNAARHSNELSAIRVAAVRGGVHIAFSVADDGVGVPAERLPHLFCKFSRLGGEERGRETGGSGLGLAICKGIVEAHGGRIRAESDGLGLGSRFIFTVPAVEEAAAVRSRRPRRRPRKEQERTRILCVDDDPQTLRYVGDALTRAGYAPIVTGDPEEVSRLMKEEAPHLVLPGSDGIELMGVIREIADVPVIFLGYTGARGYHPLLAVAAGTGDVLMARLREGRANTARGAAHFLRETVGRVRCAGARGQLTVRADSGFYTHALVSACRRMDVRFSITIRQHASLRNLIEAIPEADWTPIPYWMDGAADVAGDHLHPLPE